LTVPPPPQVPKPKPYITVIEDRRPREKAHSNIGQAKNAVGLQWWSGEKLIEVIDGIATGRSKYVNRVRGGQVWWLNPNTAELELLYDIPTGALESELPWRAEEYEFYVVS
jgi:hypothetical protein